MYSDDWIKDAIKKIEQQILERDQRIAHNEERVAAIEKCLADFVGAFQTAIATAAR